MITSYKAQGVILSRRNYSEADKIVTFFSRQYGKLRVLAKGVRRINSRRASHIELFNYTRIILHKGANFDIITEAEILQSFNQLKKDLKKIAVAYYLTELVDRLCPERQEHNDILSELIQSLASLNDPVFTDFNGLIDRFSVTILTNLGFMSDTKNLHGEKLQYFIEEIIEKKLKTTAILTKINE